MDRDPAIGAGHDLHEIRKAADRMASLTRQLLAFSRQQILRPETLDLNAAVADSQSLLQRLIGTDVEMVAQLGHGPKWVQVDRSQLLQVRMNLAINARDAMPAGGELVTRTGAWISGYPRDTAFPGAALPPEQAFLEKPVSPEVLLATARQLIGRSGSRGSG